MQLTMTIPDDLASHFENEEELKRTLYEDFIIQQRQSGTISLGKAAELLDLSYQDFFALLGKKGLSFINATHDELDNSYQDFCALMQKS